MPSCPTITRDPLDKIKITVDFGTWLPSGVTIQSASWVVPTGVTESSSSNSSTEAINYFTFAREDEFEIACTITTDESPNRQKTQRFILNIENPC